MTKNFLCSTRKKIYTCVSQMKILQRGMIMGCMDAKRAAERSALKPPRRRISEMIGKKVEALMKASLISEKAGLPPITIPGLSSDRLPSNKEIKSTLEKISHTIPEITEDVEALKAVDNSLKNLEKNTKEPERVPYQVQIKGAISNDDPSQELNIQINKENEVSTKDEAKNYEIAKNPDSSKHAEDPKKSTTTQTEKENNHTTHTTVTESVITKKNSVSNRKVIGSYVDEVHEKELGPDKPETELQESPNNHPGSVIKSQYIRSDSSDKNVQRIIKSPATIKREERTLMEIIAKINEDLECEKGFRKVYTGTKPEKENK